jgi:hypothetical protein
MSVYEQITHAYSIQLNLWCWMAARIQANINAPCKEKNRVRSVTVEHSEQLLPEPSSHLHPRDPELALQEGSLDTSESPPPCSEHRRNLSVAVVGAKPKADTNRSRSRGSSHGSHHSDGSFPFIGCVHADSDTVADFTRSRNNGFKRQKIDVPERRSHTRSHEGNTEVTSTVDANLPSETPPISRYQTWAATTLKKTALRGSTK